MGEKSKGPLALPVSSVTDVVYGHLRRLILDGMSPGEPLRLTHLASEFGVSTTPVRTALERLAADGLVIAEGRRGATVAPLSLSDFRDIYTVRRCLEGAAARIGTEKLTGEDLEKIQEASERLDRIALMMKPEVDDYLEAEWDIHEICYRACGSPRLVSEIQSYRRQAERYFRLALREGVNLLDDLHRQREFSRACLAGASAEAEGIAVELLDWTVDHVGPVLEQDGVLALDASRSLKTKD